MSLAELPARPALLHYAHAPFTFDRNHIYREHGYQKPLGFWVSVQGEDDWASWCHREEFGLGEFVYEVTLTPGAKVLWIESAHGIDSFHAIYSVADDFSEHLHNDLMLGGDFAFRQRPIDWAAVAKEYAGIIIAPYQWSRRLNGPMWYYGIDAASGCIWDLGAIERVEAR